MYHVQEEKRKQKKGLCVSVVHPLRMSPHHGLRQDYNNSITEEPTCRLVFFSNKFTAVYSSYRHLFYNKKSTTIFIKLEGRKEGGKPIQE